MRCPICESTTNSFDHEKLSKTYHACPACEYIFLDPAFYVSQEREHAQYAQHQNSMENQGYVAMFERFIAFFQVILPNVRTALDFGSGPGPVLCELLKQRGIKTAIYDLYFAPHPSALTHRYDLITSTEVIEHLASPMAVLLELKALLHEGGYLALMTQFHPRNREAFCTWWYPRDPTHIGFFTPKTFEIIGKKLSLKLIACDTKSMVLFQK